MALLRWMVVLAALVVAGCNGEAPQCDADNPCDWGEDCIDGVCTEGGCATSAQCGMEHHCVSRQCVAGCDSDYDCYPDDTCSDQGTCEPAACEETQVDCGFREFCNSATGECYDAGGDFCRPCSQAEIDCEEGNLCYGGYCLVDCSGGRECPAGFDCYAFVDGSGNVIFHGCFTYCWLYDDYEPEDARSAPDPPVPPFDLPPGTCDAGLRPVVEAP